VIDQKKIDYLEKVISDLQGVTVAFSGGTDSALLLAMCSRVLGREHVLAVTADSPSLPRSELNDAEALARELGVEHVVIATHEMQDEHYVSNPSDRCYYCKRELFTRIRALATDGRSQHLVYGATADDLGDFRPGMQAAEAAGAVAPLLEAGFTKQDVRELSRQLGLRTWDKPAMACLSSRFPYGTRITPEKLRQVELGEDFLRRQQGFRQVRVRHHGDIVRIEVPIADFSRLLDAMTSQQISSYFKTLGYTYITLDIEGFRSGSMNESLRSRLDTISDEIDGEVIDERVLL